MSTDALKQAIDAARAELGELTAEQLSLPTPCASWKVSDLVNHMIGGQFFFAAAAKGEAPSGDTPDFAAGDFKASFDQASAACVSAFERDGVMEQVLTLPFGKMPGSAVVGLVTTDTFTHAWDLAKAVGCPAPISRRSSPRDCWRGPAASISESFRGPDTKAPFGAEQTASPTASNADKLAAFLGRSV